jgi:schlafen family protein
MLPRIIDSWLSLPRASGSYLQERVWFDLKATYAPKSQAEMAKDVAAFANALGGAIIIGANEGATEPDYSSPLSSNHAAGIENEFDQAVRHFCRPSPTAHVRTIPVPGHSAKVLLVVNVEPIVDQPVAARHPTDKDMWRFPLRVGRHTEYLLPEQLPLHMNSKARRAKLLLLRTVDAGGDIDLFTVPSGGSRHATIQGSDHFVVVSVDDDSGGSLVLRATSETLGHQSVTIPIDDIEAVWLQHTGRWAVRASGRLEQFNAADGSVVGQLIYTPPTTFVVSPLGRVVDDLSKRVRDIAVALQGTLAVENHPRTEPSDAAIAECAYAFWRFRVEHNIPGSADDDWLRARLQVLAQNRGR